MTERWHNTIKYINQYKKGVSDWKHLLKFSGNNKKWLENELQKQKIGNVKDVFIALCDGNNTLSVYKKTDDSPKNDPFQ